GLRSASKECRLTEAPAAREERAASASNLLARQPLMKREKQRRRRPTNGRGCGECRACCVVLGFEARPGEAPFAKPAGVACPHVCAAGCAIYAERPPVCVRFQCAWLQTPSLPAALRPDRCGVLFA